MIELSEALTIARQMTEELQGKRIESATRGNSPHKFAFYTGPPEKYESILKGKTMGRATEHGSLILAAVEPDHLIVLGGGGERILYHLSERTLPKKRHLLLHFEDGSYLTVTVQGWGSVQLLHESEVAGHPYVGKKGVSPLSDEFTFDAFDGLFEGLEADDKRSVKYFVISEPGVLGVGNGYLQDILFRAKIHPKRRVVEMAESERRALYDAIRGTLRQAADLGGRDTERDLYNQRGGYSRILHSKARGKPCSECGALIEKIQYLGGACYFCPSCQTSPGG
jgi:formamidopyrimidine-DNA glycosylase